MQEWVNLKLKDYLQDSEEIPDITRIDIENMVHWLEQYDRPELIKNFSVDKVLNSSKKWMVKLTQSGEQVTESLEDIEVVVELSDGYKLVKLIGEKSYRFEGNRMQHCVASYYGKSSSVYSLRDSKGLPHCTIEIGEGRVRQIKGKQNRFVVSKYVPYVIEGLSALNLNLEDSHADMSNLGLLKICKEEVDTLSKIAGEDIPFTIINGTRYINSADGYWHDDKVTKKGDR